MLPAASTMVISGVYRRENLALNDRLAYPILLLSKQIFVTSLTLYLHCLDESFTSMKRIYKPPQQQSAGGTYQQNMYDVPTANNVIESNHDGLCFTPHHVFFIRTCSVFRGFLLKACNFKRAYHDSFTTITNMADLAVTLMTYYHGESPKIARFLKTLDRIHIYVLYAQGLEIIA